ncbi:MAG: heavy metal translocating P-type ATPase [Candidatus Aminicenantales bacterium]
MLFHNVEKEKGFDGIWYAHPPLRNALIAGFLTGITFVLSHLGFIPTNAEVIFYIIAILLGGYHWANEGIEELFREKKIGIEILMLAATVGSTILGMWDEAAFLAFLYGAAEGLEEYTFAKTRASIKKLLDLAPKEARVFRGGSEVTIPAEELKAGEVFTVKPGESIPTDGIIIRGTSCINEAPVTGESIPVEKKEGMKVFAGTMNQQGALEIKATTSFQDNTLSRMVHLVEEAQEQKGRAHLFIDKFGWRYSPLVLASASLLIVIPPFFGAPFYYWASRAVVFLVAAAPCALVMSTPVAIAAGIGRAGRSGVLIKGGVHLENLAKIKVVAFDKTGTLTEGRPVVTDVVALDRDESEIFILASSVEKLSEHPLAKAIVKKAKELGITPSAVTDFTAIAGYGAKAKVKDENIYVGKQSLFRKLCRDNQYISQKERLRQEGKTVIFVGTEDTIAGIIAIRDAIRPGAKQAINTLRDMGIKVVMLTGDNALTAKALAEELGIDDVRADLMPEDKIQAVRELEQKYGTVAMVGDGINDAPALSAATVGIAMGTAGTDAAIEAADTALMADDLKKVIYAVSLGKKAGKIIRQNIIFSLIILAVLIPSSLIGIMSVALAVFFHEASELLAVANGLRTANISDD